MPHRRNRRRSRDRALTPALDSSRRSGADRATGAAVARAPLPAPREPSPPLPVRPTVPLPGPEPLRAGVCCSVSSRRQTLQGGAVVVLHRHTATCPVWTAR
ncbi:hypothetical protein OG689_04510 [Kitasatospora sp. NBC_00240]|uniref:hypothetical protein n=1 Tax=Kitasatospora sp. NBC_00240 TaxID=2903567 RepID=UPI00224E9D03|nr:hypothetical protein [Kitasatospora sp. NBC_00240]MCX5208564.1 hypothetical protein [Kitasatospora sp. NBC_00240]